MANEYNQLTEEEKLAKLNVDLATISNGYGAVSQAATDAMMGFDHRGAGIMTPMNADNQGMTFFTRPRLNLSYDNIAQDRVLSTMLTSNEKTYARAIRVLLDPVGARPGNTDVDAARSGAVVSRVMDNKCAFIPILSNYLLSCSGWPDPVAEYFDSTPGVAKEVWSIIDGSNRYRGSFDLQMSWRNVAGDPITSLLLNWIIYALNVYDGTMVPYPEAIIENEIDYQTRVYRFILDPSRRFIQKVAAANACFPWSSGIGAAFNFSSDNVFNVDTNQVSAPFHCIGVDYQDPILFHEFNRLVCHFNNDMFDGVRDERLRKVRMNELTAMNRYGYPRVNDYTQELEWWVYPAEYNRVFGLK